MVVLRPSYSARCGEYGMGVKELKHSCLLQSLATSEGKELERLLEAVAGLRYCSLVLLICFIHGE